MQRQHGTAHTSFRMSSAMAASWASHFFSRSLYLSRVYAWLAFLALSSSFSRSPLNAFALSAATMSADCFAINISRQFEVAPGFCGHLQQAGGSGHGLGGSRLGGVAWG